MLHLKLYKSNLPSNFITIDLNAHTSNSAFSYLLSYDGTKKTVYSSSKRMLMFSLYLYVLYLF
ncbi:hypothetical protein HanIR_Chr09g0441411 [Helianthus annuus]|nr:hypothetical protein HanIR_Chr09g0441411 [Helianthus annuus]